MGGKLTIEDLLDMRTVSDVEVARDGRRIAFVVRPSSYEKGTVPEGCIWVSDGGGQPRQVTRGPGSDSLPTWSPDGDMLAFASDRDHAGLLSPYLLDFTGEARPLGDVNGSVEAIRWSADGSELVVLAADPGSDRAGGQSATKIQAKDAEPPDPVVRRPNESWRRLYRIARESGETAEVSPEGVNVWEFDWTGEGDAVAVITNDPSESAWYDARVAVLDLAGRASRDIYRAEWQLQSPVMSADRTRVAFVEGFNSDRTVLTGTITVVDAGGGAASEVAPQLDVVAIRWSGDDELAYVGVRGLETMCGTVALDGTVKEAWSGRATLGATHRMAFSCSADGRVFAAPKEAPNEPVEVALLEAGWDDWRPLTSFNSALAGRASSTVDRFAWTTDNGEETEGLLVLPEGSGGEPLPLVVVVHGGPTNAWTFNFSFGYMHMGLMLAEHGYAVLLPNTRGSTGRGQPFARSNLGDMGGGDLRDILAGIEALAEAGIVDRERVGVTGGSYGGFMSTWAPTQTDAFAAAVPFAITSNWLSFHNTTNIGRFDELYLQSDPYDVNGGYFSRSPVMFARSCHTPMLILHGQLDLCCPVGQAQEMYQALVDAGCETELVIYSRGGHGWAERGYLIDTWDRSREWFDRYLRTEAAAA